MNSAFASIAHYLEAPDIHEAAREEARGLGIALLFSALLTLAHGANLFFFIAGDSAPLFGLLVHLVLVVATAFVARIMISAGMDSRFLMVLLVGTAFMSVLGAIGTAISILHFLLFRRHAKPFITWFGMIFPRKHPSSAQQTYEDILSGKDESTREYSVIPFMDVMVAGTEAQKREALSRMTMQFDPSFAPAFRKGMADSSNSIRVQAASAISKVENQFMERLMQITRLYRTRGNDPQVVLALAEHYDDYAFTGILDPERERINRDQALKHYLEYLDLRSDDEATRIHVGRLMLRMDMPKRAADWYKDCVALGYESNDLLVWYSEALFASRRFTSLRQLAARHTELGEKLRSANPELAEALLLWSGRSGAVPVAVGGEV